MQYNCVDIKVYYFHDVISPQRNPWTFAWFIRICLLSSERRIALKLTVRSAAIERKFCRGILAILF